MTSNGQRLHGTTRIVCAGGVGLAIIGLAAGPALGAAQVKPKAGSYSGSATYPSGAVPVSFRVNRKGTQVIDFSSDAETKAGCKAPNSSFETPLATKKISASGRFKQSYDAYTDASGKNYGVTVTVEGRFTSNTKVVGKFILVSKKYKNCNQTAAWSAAHSE